EGTLTPSEYTLIKKDGTRFIGEVNTAVIHSPEGSPMRMIVITRDVTERKRAEDAVLRAKEDWERTFDAVPDMIAILDKDYRIVRVNKAMAARLGVTPVECIGLRCYHAVHG